MSGGADAAVLDAHGNPIPLSERGPASTWSMISFGFWLFLLSDIVIFAVAVRHLRGAVESHRRRPLGPRHLRSEECLH